MALCGRAWAPWCSGPGTPPRWLGCSTAGCPRAAPRLAIRTALGPAGHGCCVGSVGYIAAQVALLDVSLHTVGLHRPLTVVLVAAAIERLGTLVPITPGGAGVAEIGAIAWLVGHRAWPARGGGRRAPLPGLPRRHGDPGRRSLSWVAGHGANGLRAAPAREVRRMRILHVTDHYPPVMAGIEAHVAEPGGSSGGRRRHRHGAHLDPVHAPRGRRCDDSGPVEVLRARSLVEGWRTETSDVDVVHAHVSVVAPFTAPLAAAAARRGVPTVVTVHSLWNGFGPLPTWAAAVAGLRGAPVTWTAVSRVAAGHLAPRLPAGTPVHLLPNAVDAAPRARTRCVDGSVRIVSTMRLAGRKRPLELLHVFDRLQASAGVPVS